MSLLITYGKDFDILKLYKNVGANSEYELEIAPILDSYRQIIKKNNSFMTSKVVDVRSQIIPLLDDFIKITKKYFKVDVIYDKSVCSTCFSVFNCKCSTPKKTEKKSNNDYEDEENFVKALNKYQGKQSKKINLTVLMADLDSYFVRYGFETGADIKLKDFDFGTRTKPNTNIKKMILALQEIGYPEYYEDVNLICHEYWGWTLPDIEEYIPQLLEDYRKTQKIYLSLEKKRKSCLNLQYRIFKHLQILNIQVKPEDFRIPDTLDILKEHDFLWKKMCEASNLTFIPTI